MVSKFKLAAFALSLALCAAVIAVAPEAVAAFAPSLDMANMQAEWLLAVPLLGGLRTELKDLEARAAAKLAEVTDELSADQARAIEAEYDAIVADVEAKRAEVAKAEADEAARKAAETRSAPVQTQQAAPVDVAGEVRSAIVAERTRSAEIRSLAATHRMPEGWAEAQINAGAEVQAARNAVLEALATRADANPTFPHVQFGGQDSDETRRAAAINALLHRDNPRGVVLEDAARQFRGMSLSDMARDFLQARGERVRGMTRSEIAARAFHSTSDFPFILENVANRSLRSAYEAYPRTFIPFTRQVTAPDFKTMYRVQLGEAPQLEKVNESGEFKRGSIREGRQSIKVDTYGKVVGITRQVIINDDLGAFTRLPAMFGTAIATLESDMVWALITGNVVMADGVALFHATHRNLATAAALSVDGIGATRAKMRTQLGLDGKTKLNVRPSFLLVPSALETRAEQILNTANQPDAPTNGVPASMRSLQVISEPRLDDVSETAYYLAASPAVVDTLEYAYLEGNEGAYVETRQGFDVDGMEVKCRLDFGVAAIDHRGLAKNAGA